MSARRCRHASGAITCRSFLGLPGIGKIPAPSLLNAGCFKVLVEDLLEFVVEGKLFLFPAFPFKAGKKPFSRKDNSLLTLRFTAYRGSANACWRASRNRYFSRNESSMGKMLQKGHFKVLENRSRFVLLVSSPLIRISRI